MIREIQDDGFLYKYACISGISNVRIDHEKIQGKIKQVCKENDVSIQFFNSQLIAGWEHIYFSAIHALNAFKQGTNLLKTLELETLLFSSGQHQIKVAIDEFGVGMETRDVVLLIMGNAIDALKKAAAELLNLINGIENDSILDVNEKKYEILCKKFNITLKELEATARSGSKKDRFEALTKLILNRIAFVVFEK